MNEDIDIVYWLRRFANAPSDGVMVSGDLLIDAADEIERLRSLIAENVTKEAAHD